MLCIVGDGYLNCCDSPITIITFIKMFKIKSFHGANKTYE